MGRRNGRTHNWDCTYIWPCDALRGTGVFCLCSNRYNDWASILGGPSGSAIRSVQSLPQKSRDHGRCFIRIHLGRGALLNRQLVDKTLTHQILLSRLTRASIAALGILGSSIAYGANGSSARPCGWRALASATAAVLCHKLSKEKGADYLNLCGACRDVWVKKAPRRSSVDEQVQPASHR